MSWLGKTRRGRVALAAAMVVVVAVMAALLLNHAGCETERPQTAPVQADLMAGQWEGIWASSANDMGGKLLCEARQSDATHYDADFHATFAKVLTNNSSVTFTVRKAGPRWEFEGSKDLGMLSGGVYTYKGYVTAEEFYSTYDSTFDRGIFRMRRATATSQPTTRAGAK